MPRFGTFAVALLAAALAAQNPPAKPATPPPAATPAPAAAAQGGKEAPPQNEAELDKQVAVLLVNFARLAEANKMPARAREAYQEILDHYEIDNAIARTGLGFKKVKTEWQIATAKDKLPGNTNNMDQRKVVTDAWATAKRRIGKLHKDLGLLLAEAGEKDRARPQLERALFFAPDDAAVHKALGHEQIDNFFGTTDEIAFVKRYRALVSKAREFAMRDVKIEPVADDGLPRELRATGYSFFGARSPYSTYWTLGKAEEAQRSALWNDRAVAMLQSLVDWSPDTRQYFNARPLRWVGVLRTNEQRQHLLEVSPATREGGSIERSVLFSGIPFQSFSGYAMWKKQDADIDADAAVGLSTKYGFPSFNPGLGEGLVHAMCWLLVGTCNTSFMSLPATAADNRESKFDPRDWINLLRDDIDAGKDWPLVQIPRERMDNFRNQVRRKAWSFMLWLLARHPEQWPHLLAKLGREDHTPEEVAKIFTETLGRPVTDVEAEWRAWMRRGSPIGRACGIED